MCDYLGISYLGDGGDNEVTKLVGTPETMTGSMEMWYYGGSSPHYSVDHIAATGGEVIFACEQDMGRMVYHQAGNDKVISSSVVMGALANGDSLNLKPYFMAEMIFDFLDYDPTVSIDETSASFATTGSFPNPFTTQTVISYHLADAGAVNLSVYDMRGRLVKTLVDMHQEKGTQNAVWDATSPDGARVKPGMYFYRMQCGKSVETGKMTVY